MDLEVARKSLSERSGFSTKKIAFVAAAGLVLAGGIGFRAYHYLGEAPADGAPGAVEAVAPEPAPTSAPEAAMPPSPAATTESVAKTPPATQEAAPAPAPSEPAAPPQAAPVPNEPAQQAGDAAEQPQPEEAAAGQAEQTDMPGSGMILVARKPVQVLASPSATAPAMYGFPAGRPFRVIGREGDFVHIKDLRSSASGWIDAAALAAPPPSAAPTAGPRAAPAATPPQAKPGSVRKPATASADPKPKPAKKGVPPVADSEPPAAQDVQQARRPPSLFGRGGFFGGVFGGGNAN